VTAVSEARDLHPWESAPFVELSDEEIRAIAARHGLPSRWRRLPSTGVIHTIYALGERCVLRVPKRIDEAMQDIRTEVVAVPAARNAGVRTPALLVGDDSLDIIDVPFTVIELVDGEPLGARPFDAIADAGVYRDLGVQLATLHARVEEVADPNGWLDHSEHATDPHALVDALVRGGRLGADSARWALGAFARLQPAVEASRSFRRFVHGDLQPNNVLVTPDAHAVLIDWGDAAWSDPARELQDLVPRAVPLVLEGYRSVMPMDGDDTAEARALFDHLFAALYYLDRPPVVRAGEWGRATGTRLVELLAETTSPSSWIGNVLSGS
jgi:Ser/Thr protein kinase RdoA (MazF antagonist)